MASTEALEDYYQEKSDIRPDEPMPFIVSRDLFQEVIYKQYKQYNHFLRGKRHQTTLPNEERERVFTSRNSMQLFDYKKRR